MANQFYTACVNCSLGQYLYSGKVFSAEELQAIAEILLRHPHVTAVMDEVYEKLVYDGKTHIRLASLPNMWDRTLTVSSCGKTFSCTGWKVGWVYGAAQLVKPVVLANQWIQYCVSSPTQASILLAFGHIIFRHGQYLTHYLTHCDAMITVDELKSV